MNAPAHREPHRRWDYPAEDDMAETLLHFLIRKLLFDVVTRWLAQQPEAVFVGSDQFVYWQEGHPHRCLAPDLFVAFGRSSGAQQRVWKTWEDGGPPRLAVEIVSDDVEKDYLAAPRRYSEMGVDELLVYDPLAAESDPVRVRFQVFRRQDGELAPVERGNATTVTCDVLGCEWVHVTAADGSPRLRISHEGSLFPTEDEAARAAEQRALLDGERATAQAARASDDAEMAQAEAQTAKTLAQHLAARLRDLGVDPDDIA
jgi:Uma2 family endonuclease